jgi:multiple sugar transport system substrate-binding protein
MAKSETPNESGGPRITRRSLIKGAAAGGGLLVMPSLLAACGDDAADTTTTTAAAATESTEAAMALEGTTIKVGSNASDELTKNAYGQMFSRFEEISGATLDINTVDHNTFQEQINTYLQGQPDEVFTWFAGFRMRFFADKGLATPFSDVWAASLDANFEPAFKQASTGLDGEQYFVPFVTYPWALFYRKSIWEEKGYTIPTTLDEWVAVCQAMEADGMVPIAFGDKDGWPAMGTFDYFNMRINGYQYHVDLMAHNEKWDDPRTKEVFAAWRDMLPYHQPGALGRTWQEAAQTCAAGDAGMYLLGMFVGEQFQEYSQEARDDLDFFAFPEINPDFGQDSVDAPIDGFMLSKTAPDNIEGAKALAAFIGTGEAQNYFTAVNSNWLATANDADTSGYTSLQNKALELIGSVDNIAQFLDRDTRPDFASTVVLPSLQNWLNDPDDIDGITASMEEQATAIFATDQ